MDKVAGPDQLAVCVPHQEAVRRSGGSDSFGTGPVNRSCEKAVEGLREVPRFDLGSSPTLVTSMSRLWRPL